MTDLVNAFMGVFDPVSFALITGGTIFGIIFGAIPGLTATLAVILLIPLSYGLEPTQGISMLVGVYIGGISGGVVAAVLLGMPGTPSSMVTVLDGFGTGGQGPWRGRHRQPRGQLHRLAFPHRAGPAGGAVRAEIRAHRKHGGPAVRVHGGHQPFRRLHHRQRH